MKYSVTGEESCKYRFTAYLMISIRRDRMTYCNKLRNKQFSEVMLDSFDYTPKTTGQEYRHNFDEPKSVLDLYFEDESLSRAIMALSEIELTVLTLKFIHDLPHRKIAARLNLSKGAIDKHYQRITSKLRKELRDNEKF